MRPKDELYLRAVARLKTAAREECCDLEMWEEDVIGSAACRRAVTDIEAILEWPED